MQTSTDTSSTSLPQQAFTLTEAAATRIVYLQQKEANPNLRFRVAVDGGGCSGFQYKFALDDKGVNEDDTIITKNGAEAIIDEVSLGMLAGSVLDYTEDLAQAGFSIKNPNATAKCGCGNSFSVSL
jgi:iron-sulfur cluster insertion protein